MIPELDRPALGAREFDALRRFIYAHTGIQLRDTKTSLVASRLAKRVRALSMKSYAEYIDYVERDPAGPETTELINCITTNKTSFFREPHHFDFLMSQVLPALRARGQRKIRIWSAGCSTGQEPWTIAMSLLHGLGSFSGWDIRILASDIDTEVLRSAEQGRYEAGLVEDVPREMRQQMFERDRDHDGHVRIASVLRPLVAFRQINLIAPPWPIHTKFDVVFCRNVAIYFDKPTQEALYNGLANLVEPGGYLISGHSENLHWLGPRFEALGHTIHRIGGGGARLPLRSPQPRAASIRPNAAAGASVRPGARRSLPPPLRSVPIEAGGVHAAREAREIRTTLGSCVAVCLFDPEARIGGMNHFMLPHSTSAARCPEAFGVHAMETLINSMMKLGADRRRLVAKLFGGARLNTTTSRIGDENLAFAREFLEAEGIPVVASKVGGNSGMVVHFETATGKARVKTLAETTKVETAERQLQDNVDKLARDAATKSAGDIEFFGEGT